MYPLLLVIYIEPPLIDTRSLNMKSCKGSLNFELDFWLFANHGSPYVGSKCVMIQITKYNLNLFFINMTKIFVQSRHEILVSPSC